MRRQALWPVVAVAVVCGVGMPGTAAAELLLAEAGQTGYAVVVAADAAAPEKTAAAELAAYLKKITGAEFAIMPPAAAAGRPVIAVGPGAAATVAPDLDLSKTGEHGLGEDGIVLEAVGKNLVLTGAAGAKRGTIYAVYEFLERACGVRWWTPTAETVPSRPTLAVTLEPIRYVPPFVYREACGSAIRPYTYEPTDEVPLFAVRMRQNGHFPKIPSAWGGHYNLIGWCHTFYDHGALLPPEKYFKEHPEWYSEIDGKRVREKAQLCMSNEDMLAELSRNVLAAIRKDPDAGMISVAMNDCWGFCQCARCRALDEAGGSPSASLLHGINRVAAAVEQEFPGFFVETLAYLDARKPPTTVRPRDNVLIRCCVIERSGVHPLEHEINRRLSLERDLQAWSALKPRLFIWDYTANLGNPFTPEPRAFVFGPDMRLYHRLGAVGVFCEHNHSDSPTSDFDELHTWLLSKLMWNPDQDDRALIREFLDGYYGPAGRALAEYQELLASRVGQASISCYWGPRVAEDWLDLDTMNRATELFDEAAAAVAADPLLTARVRRARIALDHQWLCRHAGYRYQSEQQNKPFRGPADRDSLVADLTARCREAGVRQVGYGAPTSVEDYLAVSRGVGERVPGRFVVDAELKADETHRAFRDGAPMPLPPELAGVSPERVVDVQEDRMWLFEEGVESAAEVVVDKQAVNHAAARLNTGVKTWAVQVRDLAGKGIKGRWHAYAVVRVEALAKTGVAFNAGVYHPGSKRNLSEISPLLEGGPGGASASGLNEPIADGRYRLYDLGVHEFTDAVYGIPPEGVHLWLGTTGGVDPKNVKAIYVDRFIFVREH
jgi:hypothetical protein